MRYAKVRIQNEFDTKAYRIYVTDALKAIGGLNTRYIDIIKPQKNETRTKDEIIDTIRRKLK